MRAAVLNSNNGVFSVEEIEIDRPKGREVLVEVKASGLCHTDLHLAEHNYGFPLPAVAGHELAGIVKEIGPDVHEFAVGDHVVGALIQCCGHCEACITGRTYQCAHPEESVRSPEQAPRLTRGGKPVTAMYGVSAFAEFTLVHENQLAKVPKEIPFPQAAILGCGCITGAGAAINTAQIRPGDTVAVVGIGGVGLNVISGAKLAGAARIVAVDTQPSKEALARRFGATDFVVADGNQIEAVRALTNGGVAHAFEVVGDKSTIEESIKMVEKGGCVYLIGLPIPHDPISIDVLTDILGNQAIIKSVWMGSTNIKHDIPMYADLYLQGRFNLDDLISKEISIDDINGAYEEIKSGSIARSVITRFRCT